MTQHYQPRFITFEGIDGAGKSTHIGFVTDYLQQRGVSLVSSREPGGTSLGEKLRELLLHEKMHLETEALLMFASRREHIAQVIAPALERGEWVISDRFTDASFAYQGGGRGFDAAVLAQLEAWVQQGTQPDLTIWFDLPAATAAARRGVVRAPDRFESQDAAFFERAIAGYAARLQQMPARFVRIDAQAERPAVWQQIQAALQARPWW